MTNFSFWVPGGRRFGRATVHAQKIEIVEIPPLNAGEESLVDMHVGGAGVPVRPRGEIAGAGRRVLVVDDEEPLLSLMAAVRENHGFGWEAGAGFVRAAARQFLVRRGRPS